MSNTHGVKYLVMSAALIGGILVAGLAVDSNPARSDDAAQTGDASKGKAIFNNQCTACHTIGGGRLVGPDLKGVTSQRPHQWLVEYIQNPEKMFKEKNPIAEKLLNEYAGVRMPDLGLSRQQANDALAYIKQQSK